MYRIEYMRIFNTIIHQLVQVMINMVSDEGAAKYTARRAACRQGRGLPDLCEVDWPILLCRRSGSIASLIELNSDNSPDQMRSNRRSACVGTRRASTP